jgi:uncharacterized Zn finger protein
MLNVFYEKDRPSKHNKPAKDALFGVDLTADEYASIFKAPVSFYEKKAHVDSLRKKWKEDKGYGSLFRKAHEFKVKKSVIP